MSLREPCVHRVTDPSGSYETHSTDVTYIEQVTSSAVVHGNFRDPNYWAYNIRRYSYYKGSYSARNSLNGSYATGSGVGTFIAAPGIIGPDEGHGPILANVYNECLSRLNEKVRGRLDLSIALAESGKTARMTNLIGRMTKMVRNLKKGNWKFRPDQWSANAWLEYQYGWRQLIDDVYNAADESLRVVLNRIENVSASCTRVEEWATDPFRQIDTGIGAIPFHGPVVNKAKRGVRMHLRFRNDDVDLARWTSLNPVSIAWELVPYSFVADWFVDVGGFLRSTETALRYRNQFVSGYWTLLEVISSVDSQSGHFSAGASSCDMSLKCGASVVNYARTVYTGYPLPTVPKFEARLGSSRLLSAAALLAQFLRK